MNIHKVNLDLEIALWGGLQSKQIENYPIATGSKTKKEQKSILLIIYTVKTAVFFTTPEDTAHGRTDLRNGR